MCSEIGTKTYHYQLKLPQLSGTHFSSHVSTLLGTWRLIFYMDACSTRLDHHLRQFHDRCQTFDTSDQACIRR